MSAIVRLQMKYGIRKFKCSTIAEAEMVAGCGADDILLAYQPVGPNIDRLFRLKQGFPDTEISCISRFRRCDKAIIGCSQKNRDGNTYLARYK